MLMFFDMQLLRLEARQSRLFPASFLSTDDDTQINVEEYGWGSTSLISFGKGKIC